MKKKIFGFVLAAALVVSQALVVCAEGSKTGEAALTGDSVGKYAISEVTEDSFGDLAETAPDVLAKIQAVNSGQATLQSIAELAPELEASLEGKTLLTQIFDLSPVGDGVLTENGNYLVTLSVPTLTAAMTDVQILHYSTQRNVWELITPSSVDSANKEITAEFQDLSPVAVIAKVNASAAADSAVGTSPKTGFNSGWIVWIGAAFVLMSASAVLLRRNKH